jgi:N-acetyl-anhydromuramyl-L-alanine amidase AmpD
MQRDWIGCAADNFRKGRHGFEPRAIVIHIIVGSLESAGMTFRDPRSSVSAHYGVGKSGRVHQFVEETDTAFHAGTVVEPTWRLIERNVNPNLYTIGIEQRGSRKICGRTNSFERARRWCRKSPRDGRLPSIATTSSCTAKSARQKRARVRSIWTG